LEKRGAFLYSIQASLRGCAWGEIGGAMDQVRLYIEPTLNNLVEQIEERVNSLFLVLMNPEDKEVIDSIKSFGDRVQRIPIPYVLDYHTEVEIYYNKFGTEIDDKFLPGVLENFAKVVISTRLNETSENLLEWINDPIKYIKFCDKNLLLLKMDIYTGQIPSWLSEDDRKKFNAKIRRKIISETEAEGQDENSISGRKSIEIFNEFYSKYSKNGTLIDMSKVHNFFSSQNGYTKKIPSGFLDSLVTLYDYNILQEVKESLYNYNKTEISNSILNYLFAINFEIGSKVKCNYTGSEIEITEEFFNKIEDIISRSSDMKAKKQFREYVQKEYTSKTLSYEMGVEERDIKDTSLYKLLMEKYQYSLKEDVLSPFIEKDNFRNAIKDYGTPEFNSYEKKIIKDVKFLIRNLQKKYNYTEKGAKQVCIYVVDNKIPEKFK
ncbi:MAG: serine protein kinase PrkA, partial [Spirochaetota bacterium]|nr:serine protein kinase PrkA [Spirochaetota bacterium]